MSTKKCYGCKKILDIKLFEPSTRSRDGLMTKCFICRKQSNKSYHINSTRSSREYCELCYQEGNIKRASFGFLSNTQKIRCTLHKTEEMVNLADLKRGCEICAEFGLFKIASFGLLSEKRKTRCVKHKTKKMMDLAHLKQACEICGKSGNFKRASFGFLSNKRQVRCTEHKTEKMINLQNLKKGCEICVVSGIFKCASFGSLTNKHQIRCAEHKTREMVNVVDLNSGCEICAESGIFKRSTFGFLSDNQKTRCAKHKTEKMVDLQNLKKGCEICAESGIFKQGAFGLLSNKSKTWCTEHKTKEMVDLVNLKWGCDICTELGIFKRSTFGLSSDKRKTRCASHKTEDMVDLVHLKEGCEVCTESDIFRRASFGRLFEKKIHCSVHSKPNEYSKNNPKCELCLEKPFYGDEKLDQIPKRCEEHHNDTDVDMISRVCENCKDEHFIPSTQKLCHGCLGWITRKKYNRGIKEVKIQNCLAGLSRITGIPEPVHDRRVMNGCTLRRPDFYYQDFTDTFSLIVEVDENQHSRYTCGVQGELIRIINLYEEDSGGFPLIFVRFNPDSYYYDGKEVKSYKGREEKLQSVIKGLKNRTEVDCKVGVIYLFYDNFESVKIEPLDYEMKGEQIIVQHKHPLLRSSTHCFTL